MITLNSTDLTTYLNRAVCFFHMFDRLFFIMIMNRLHLVECLNVSACGAEAITGFIPLPTVEATSLLALNGGGRFLSPPALLPCLVRDSLCTALQTKILWINWSLNAIDTIETWVSGNLTALTERSQPAIRWRVGEVANRVSCGSFRGGH